jgi:hypothetical protein
VTVRHTDVETWNSSARSSWNPAQNTRKEELRRGREVLERGEKRLRERMWKLEKASEKEAWM